MRIALISTEKLPIPNIRGGAIQTYITGIIPHLSKISNLTVYSISDPDLPLETVKKHYNVIRLSGETWKEYIFNVLKKLEKEKYDLIHVFNRPRAISILKKTFPFTPITLSIHSNVFAHDRLSEKNAVKCLKKVDGIVTVSKYLTDEIIAIFPPVKNRIKHIYEGVDTEVFYPKNQLGAELRKNFNIGNSRVILNVGRLTWEKGIHLLVKAFPEVLKYFPNTILMLIGANRYVKNRDYFTYLENLLNNLVENKYIFLQDIHPDQIHKFFTIANIFVTTSQWEEPLARVHYEAMASGLPIITTPQGGNGEVIKDGWNGLIVQDYQNPEAFSEKIIKLLYNEQLAQKLGANGRELAIQHFTWKRVALELKAFFKEVVEGE